MPPSLSPLDIDPAMLAAAIANASPQAKAAMGLGAGPSAPASNGALSPDDAHAAVAAIMNKINGAAASDPNTLAADAVRKSIGQIPGRDDPNGAGAGGFGGLTQGDYSELPSKAKGKITSWYSGPQGDPLGGMKPTGQSFSMKNGVRQSQTVYSDPSGKTFHDDGTGAMVADSGQTIPGTKEDWFAQQEALKNGPQYTDDQLHQKIVDDIKGLAAGGGADSGPPSSQFNQMMDATGPAAQRLVDALNTQLANKNLAHAAPAKVLSPEQQAAMDYNKAQYEAKQQAQAKSSHDISVRGAMQDADERKARMAGIPADVAHLLATQGGGDGGLNPAMALASPQLYAGQIEASQAGNRKQLANAETTKANASQTEANAHSQELGFLQTPMGLAQSLARAGQPVPPEIAQAAARQAMANSQGSGTNFALGAAVGNTQGMDPKDVLDHILSQSGTASDEDLAKALLNRIGPTDIAALKKQLSPGSFNWLQGMNPFNGHYQELGPNHGVLNKLGILPSESPEQAQLRQRKLQILEKALGQIAGGR